MAKNKSVKSFKELNKKLNECAKCGDRLIEVGKIKKCLTCMLKGRKVRK